MAVIRPPMFAGLMFRQLSAFTQESGSVTFGGGTSLSLSLARPSFAPPPLRWARASDGDRARSRAPSNRTTRPTTVRAERAVMGWELRGGKPGDRRLTDEAARPEAKSVRPGRVFQSYSYPIWKLTRPSGSRRTFVTWTGSPPPRVERLDGTVDGVNALFAGLGYGTALRWTVGPVGPSTPWDSSRTGRSLTTRQMRSPSPGRSASKPRLARFSSSRYSLPSARTRTLKHSRAESSIG